MKAVRIHSDNAAQAAKYSAANPAPPEALRFDTDLEIPQPTAPNEVLIRVHASTVTRDELKWPETYSTEIPIMGFDLAGTVVSVSEGSQTKDADDEGSHFKIGDEVYGMVNFSNGATWAEYAVAPSAVLASKPEGLSWAESAAVPLSALTAWQALFVKAGLEPPEFRSNAEKRLPSGKDIKEQKSLLVTGAAGAVGIFVVQVAALAGLRVTAASSSNARNRDFLLDLGAAEVVQYDEFRKGVPHSDIVIDTVGGHILEQCWSVVRDGGTIISVDSGSYDFVDRHHQLQLDAGKADVKAIFFIVELSGQQLQRISEAFRLGLLKVFVARTFPLAEARMAYEVANGRLERRGKVVLTI